MLETKQYCSPLASIEKKAFFPLNIFSHTGLKDLKWDNHIDSIAKKAQQRLYFLRQLRKFNLPQELLKQFYSDIIETVLYSSITVWRLQWTVRTAERIIGRAVMVAVTTASPVMVGCHHGCVLPPVVVHVTSHTL